MTNAFNRRSVIAVLKKAFQRVTFIRLRQVELELFAPLWMRTLIPEAINGEVRGENTEVVVVWDLDKKG
jgi:hypothetical protein